MNKYLPGLVPLEHIGEIGDCGRVERVTEFLQARFITGGEHFPELRDIKRIWAHDTASNEPDRRVAQEILIVGLRPECLTPRKRIVAKKRSYEISSRCRFIY